MVLKCLLLLKTKTKLFALTLLSNKKLFQTHKHKEKKTFENNEQVPKSPWITTVERVITPSLSINLPPEPRN